MLVKVKLSLCLSKYHAMLTHREVEVSLLSFLTSALGGGEWSVSHPDRVTLGETIPGAHWIEEDWVGLRSGLDSVENKNSLLLPGIEPRLSSP
jgi:hypothetical protein